MTQLTATETASAVMSASGAPNGTAAGLSVALAVSLFCNFGFWWLRRGKPLAVAKASSPP